MRDRETTATGWRWLDTLTAPYWKFSFWSVNRKLDLSMGAHVQGSKRMKRRAGRKIVRETARKHYERQRANRG